MNTPDVKARNPAKGYGIVGRRDDADFELCFGGTPHPIRKLMQSMEG